MPRNLPRRFAGLATAGAVLLSLTGGCEDQASRQCADALEVITDAGRERELALMVSPAPGEEAFEDTRRRIQKVANSLSDITGADPGQQAAADLLLAASHRRLAGMGVAEAAMLEAEHRGRRALLHSHLDSAIRLETLASSRERLSTEATRTLLAGDRAANARQLESYSRRVAELDGPIADRETRNREDGDQAARLDREANDLRRQAADQGHARGLPTYEEAIRREREADQYEYRIAHRDNELDYEYRPEHQLAQRRVDIARTILREIAASEQSLDQHEALLDGDLSTTRDMIAEIRGQIGEARAEIDEVADAALADHYTMALSELEKTRTFANRALKASPREGKDAARIALARAWEVEGRLHSSRAIGLAGRRTLLSRMIEAEDAMGDTAALRSELSLLDSAHEETVEKAKAALAGAKDALGGMTGRDAQPHVQRFIEGLEDHLALLAGESRPERSPRGAAPDEVARGPGGGGFESAEELLAALRSAEAQDLTAMTRIIDAFHAPSPQSRAMVRSMRDLSGPMADFMSTLRETFGSEALEQAMTGPASSMGVMSPEYEDLQIESRTDDQVVVQYLANDGMTTGTMNLVRIGDRWFIDADSLAPDLTPERVQQMDLVTKGLSEMFRNLAERVRSGEFASMDQLGPAMMTEMTSALGGGMEMPDPGMMPGRP